MSAPAIPVVDLRPLAAGPAGLSAVAAEVGRACRTTGFFYAAHAPVPEDLREAVFAASRAFFAAPAERKAAVAISRHNRGYVGLGAEALDPARGADRKEAFNIGLDLPPDDPEVLAGRPFRGPNLWPDVPGFRDAALRYYAAMLDLGRQLHRAIAADLGLAPDWFDDKLARPLATLRLLRYPAAAAGDPDAERGAGRGLGAGAHTDYGNLTLLATDGVGGLEVRARDGTWLEAPPVPGTFVCNIGDCLMRWTNDVYVSTPHRVVSPAGRERYAVAFFLDAAPDALVESLPGCVAAERPSRYDPISVADYLRGRLDATHRP